MKKKFVFLMTVVGALFFTGCSIHYGEGLSSVEINDLDMKTVHTLKQGKSCYKAVLTFPIENKYGVRQAAQKANISNVKLIENEDFWLLGGFLYREHCVIVYGK